jgi:hypothetical protein
MKGPDPIVLFYFGVVLATVAVGLILRMLIGW